MSRVLSQAERLINDAVEQLREAGVASPETDAELLLCYVTGVPRALLRLRASLDQIHKRAYLDLIDARARRIPLQHLTGSAAFRYVELEVGPGVFVPRPETESLAGWAIERAGEHESAVVVDLCTGSGAIALSIVHELPTARVHAVELDDAAFDWAQRNLSGTGVDLRRGDAFHAFADLNGSVDVVVCNPPYIPLSAWESVEPEAREHDPGFALFSGDDGLDALRALERAAWRLLRSGGVVGAEHAEVQGPQVQEMFAKRWSAVVDNRDLAGRDRKSVV